MIGFIGLGMQGKPMAINLIKAGYKLVVHDKNAILDELLSLGAEGAVSGKEVALRSDIVITMLPNLHQVREAILGTGGVIEELKSGSILVEMSSIPQDLSRELADAVKAKDAAFLDGTVTLTSGGNKAVFEKIEPILSVIGVTAASSAL